MAAAASQVLKFHKIMHFSSKGLLEIVTLLACLAQVGKNKMKDHSYART